MVPLEMSMDARMMLARMSLIYEKEQGTRVKMSQDEDIVAMINFAWETLNIEYMQHYQSFVKLLTAGEIRHLMAQGAKIYRGAVVPEESEERPADAANAEQPQRSYRGVVVAGASEPAATTPPQPAAVPSSAEPEQPAKPKRVYRGRVIEE